ncbi:MAG: hypothetical protein KKB81_03200 [Candidatus Margulisbacteria bacterium]|nr:hypothetical protein [Candidatus Margulisiibacteriota bacterium]MBU1022252.1 hypothetical protein [Candidatus Margulisiibacteriota bacterium]MBU1729309.1 hypothetical protein [Candidatus Margulisiibacteriota bacterium]MBU1955582.1 hypothetical protein [Candidatus Margulisiibacteriota bacterium]
MKSKAIQLLVIIGVLVLIAIGLWRTVGLDKEYRLVLKEDLGENRVLYGYSIKASSKDKTPASFIEIYENSKPVYKFSPVVPKSVDYPRPLFLENAEVIKRGPSDCAIVTSWGETGADYFGTHPIVFYITDGKVMARSFYKGNLADDSRIKNFSWTQKDFYVKNYFNETEKVKTILTQGVALTKDDKVELSFYGDDLPHAAQHKYIKIKIPLTD